MEGWKILLIGIVAHEFRQMKKVVADTFPYTLPFDDYAPDH